MRYNTKNPLGTDGSSDPRDLYDNAGNLDLLSNSKTLISVPDRLGLSRTTLHGYDLKFKNALEALGLYPVPGSFESGGVITNINQVLQRTTPPEGFFSWGGEIPPGGKVVPAGSTVAGTGGEGVTAWTNRNDATFRAALALLGSNVLIAGLPAADIRYASFNDRLGIIAARMQAGEDVAIACYGDSTVEGINTTPLVRNPTSPVGSADQNLNAPNAWPAKLQSILREIYNNSNIKTYNAGYANQRMDNGWAVANYDAAVINNPFYGVPDVTIVAFGLNDIAISGSQIADHVTQTRILLRKIIDDGTVPVLATTDAEAQNGQFGNTRDHKEARRELDSAKKSLAIEFGIPLIDFGQLLKDWIQNNTDGYVWTTEQDDNLHFSNDGHAYKAQCATKLFFNDFVEFNGGQQSINSWSSQTAYVGDSASFFKLSNNAQGGNVVYASGAPALTDMMTLWVWSSVPNAHLIYLGTDNEFYSAGTYTIPPKISVKEFFNGSVLSKNIISAGGSLPTSGINYRRSDEPFIHSKLKYGLNKVTYVSGDAATLFYAGFKIVESEMVLPGNVLAGVGRFAKSFVVADGHSIKNIPAKSDLSNTAGCFDGEKVSISFDVSIATRSAGVFLLRGQGFTGLEAAVTNNQQTAIMLLRSITNNRLELYRVTYSSATNPSSSLIGVSADGTWATPRKEGRFEIEKVAGVQRLTVYDAWAGGNAILTADLTGTSTARWAGLVGGFYYNGTAPSQVDTTMEIHNMVINR
ncbi:GDSL-type esterase/lipase family protein [Rheinheimera sp. MM224]|uniref:GDSL-type esterase/lipase family protein n=1 Tax=Rheinheimera sp. MM224 TaxID=3019969 RepID=UPI0021F8365B|nr:GDSL-type esterase/lipase family protein [Rheinheimera sp. MM224]CAI3796068.1 hypothetical protein JAMGFMIE_01475 [Rheinheimera sp. MM224]